MPVMVRSTRAVAVALLLAVLPLAHAQAGTKTYGNVEAKVVRVYDGDTITVNINQWPALIGDGVGVRVYGIDTREIGEGGEVAKAKVEALIPAGSTVLLCNLRRDKYFRILADISFNCKTYESGDRGCKDLATILIAEKYALPYTGGTKLEFGEGIK